MTPNTCIPFILDFPCHNEVGEYTIKFSPSEGDTLADLIKFLGNMLQKRVNIELCDATVDVELLSTLILTHPNLYFKLQEIHRPYLEKFTKANLNFFFDLVVNNWDTFNSIKITGVSDIYIGGELGFFCSTIKKILKPLGIKSRVYVNIAQMKDPFSTNDSLKSFFIRPEDIEIYAKKIDTFEFFYHDISQLITLWKIYFEDKYWFGNLAEIIVNLDTNINSRNLIPEFATFRRNCGKSCIQGSGCMLCERTVNLSETLTKKGLLLKRKSEE